MAFNILYEKTNFNIYNCEALLEFYSDLKDLNTFDEILIFLTKYFPLCSNYHSVCEYYLEFYYGDKSIVIFHFINIDLIN